jgi:carbon monoxide dehydrogenase subunit G
MRETIRNLRGPYIRARRAGHGSTLFARRRVALEDGIDSAMVRIENVFEVPAAPDTAWALLTDVPRVTPCMPGAKLERTVDESTWEVLQRVKLGPISLHFRSEVTRTEMNEVDRRAVLSIKATEVRGRGGANATIESSLEPAGGGTRVTVVTELSLRGAVAQYGRPVVGSVAEELTTQFATCLASMLETEAPSAPPADAKPIAGLRLLFRTLWRRLFRRG